jgi:hypothetical protein
MDESVVKDTVNGVGSLFHRVGEFFHVFDLSFFVSGAATVGAVVYWMQKNRVPLPLAGTGWVGGLALILACYIAGLVSFAAGRWIAGLWREGKWRGTQPLGERFHAKLSSYPEESLPAKAATHLQTWQAVYPSKAEIGSAGRSELAKGDREALALYIRLWTDLRESRSHHGSFALLNRYWVMAATYDGLGVSFLAWLFAFLHKSPAPCVAGAQLISCAGALLAAVLCFRQGYFYFTYQVGEIVATWVAAEERLIKE